VLRIYPKAWGFRSEVFWGAEFILSPVGVGLWTVCGRPATIREFTWRLSAPRFAFSHRSGCSGPFRPTQTVLFVRSTELKRPPLHLALLLFGSLLLTSCSDTMIDPFENEEKYFTIWGYIDQLSTEHEIRVIPVTRFAENIVDPNQPEAQIDAEVFSVDLFSGERRKWIHELAQLEDGTYGHVFRSRFIVSPKRTYRIEVIRSDGKMTSAETYLEAMDSSSLMVRSPVSWNQDSTHAFQDVEIPGIASPWEIQAIYRWEGGDQASKFLIPYGRPGERSPDGAWRVRLHISDDQPKVQEHIEWAKSVGIIPPGGPYGLVGMGFQVRILDKNWDPPRGIFDPEVLAQPGVLSNVENGYGFYGSMGLYIQEWSAAEVSKRLGYAF
jgi:hypothetical protein